ncbi:hypothetical protein [Curtobacterium aetherium]|uniref:Uncharacterized protein n=1 Tax=Curtobacterium aetherium TaxID=2841594 RepID=A0ACD1E1B2_9MICO|nr:hypothetical protein [Curtobacterium sp. L6-1]QWS32690.1 hypothetical protein KM842_10385 [Curtobacterium sp. L6-1]
MADGPWSAEFAQARGEASPYERKVLTDGVVTAAELSDSHRRVQSCMHDGGFDLEWSEENTYEVTPSDGSALTEGVDAALEKTRLACLDRWDHSITYLFTETRRNPEKQDDAKITAACLRTSGLVGPDYTERRWRSEHDTGTFSFDEYDPAAVQCRLDPLGLWRQG